MTRRALLLFASAILSSAVFVACSNNSNGGNQGGNTAPAITSANSTTFTLGAGGSFLVTVTGTPMPTITESGALPSGVTFQDNGNWSATLSGTPAVGTAGSYPITITATNGVGTPANQNFTLTVNSGAPPSNVRVLTYHNDNARTGLNSNETLLTTSNVKTNFKKLGTIPVDGLLDAEPLYVGSLSVGGTVHNVLYVATEHDSVYAFDADPPFAQLWKTSVLGASEATVKTSDVGNCSQVSPEIGVTSTPVIDLNQGPHGTIFVVAMSKNGGSYFQRLHALDLTTGAEIGTPTTISATFPGTGANSNGTNVTFDPKQYKDRAALLLIPGTGGAPGTIYTTWASHCDGGPYTGWIMGYSESTLAQTSVLNITPNGSQGAIWMAGGGPAADSAGSFYLLVGNGSFSSTPSNFDAQGFPKDGNYGNAFLKLATGGSPPLKVADYFNMHDTVSESTNDFDLGSGGAVVLVDMTDKNGTTQHLAIGAGKDSRIYVVNRDSMGKFNSSTDNIYQEVTGAFPCTPGVSECVFSTPAFFNGTVYYGAVGDTLKAFPFTQARLAASAASHSPATFGYPGTTPSISANGTTNPLTNGIVWAIENGSTGVLHAYDATNLAMELYNTNMASGGRDQFSTNSACKFVTPMIANGRVYVGTATGVVVFGLF